MKIKKINGKDVNRDLSFNKYDLLKFCIRNTLNDFYDSPLFIHDVFWSLFDTDVEDITSKDGYHETEVEFVKNKRVSIGNVDSTYHEVMLMAEKLYEELENNEERFKSKMILFDDNE